MDSMFSCDSGVTYVHMLVHSKLKYPLLSICMFSVQRVHYVNRYCGYHWLKVLFTNNISTEIQEQSEWPTHNFIDLQ